MTIYKGNKKVVAVQRGGNPISKIYKGNSLVWQKDGTEPSPEPVILKTINATRSFMARNYVPQTMSFLSTNDGSTEQYFPNTVTIDGEIFNINGNASTFGKLPDGQSMTVIFAIDNYKQVGDFKTTLFTASYMGQTIEVHYNPTNFDEVWMIEDDKWIPIKPVNKKDNSKIRRKRQETNY